MSAYYNENDPAAAAKPRLLDLFCGAGGAAMGYHRAGFEVVGVDIKPQPRYPFEFHQGDAMTWPLDGFDVVHASPPCQAHTSLKTAWNAKKHDDLIPATRAYLEAYGGRFVIENVPGAPLREPIVLCGSMFRLGLADAELRRHRLFEAGGVRLKGQRCEHGWSTAVIGVYGGHGRDRRRTVGVYGGGHGESKRGKEAGQRNYSAAEQRQAMGIDWMTVDELSQAIPPAYTEFIGRQIIGQLRGER